MTIRLARIPFGGCIAASCLAAAIVPPRDAFGRQSAAQERQRPLTSEEERERQLLAKLAASLQKRAAKEPAPQDATLKGLAADPSAAEAYSRLDVRSARAALNDFARSAERQRVDHQLGVAGGAGGLVTRSGLGDLIDIAVESGAVTRTFEQNAVTVRANAAGLARFLTNKPVVPGVDSPFWNRVELSASFDTGEGTTKQLEGTPVGTTQAVTVSPTVTEGRFRSAALRWSSDPKNARSEAALVQWGRFVQRVMDDVRVRRFPTAGPTDEPFVAELSDELQRRAESPDFVFLTRPGWSYSLDGTYSTPALQPKVWAVKIVASWAPEPCPGDCATGAFTFNLAYTGYVNSQPTADGETTRHRDFSAAVQFDRKVGRSEHALALTIGGYGQWQVEKGVLEFAPDTSTLPGTTIPIPKDGLKLLTEKGWLGALQAGLIFTLPGGVKAPLTFAYSNRTEFRKKPEARAFFGLLLNTFALRD